MEIQPPSSIEQATARFTGLTQQQVKDQIKRIYPYPPINTLLQSKNTLEAISSSGSSKDFNEKNLIEAHRLLTPFITNPWQSVQNIEQGKADPRYYDSGISDIKDLIGSTMGTVTGASQINDPRESFVENLLKLKVFKGHVDNEHRADYVKNLFLTQTEMGASYYQTQAIRQNEELSKHFADKRNGISPLSSHTFIQGVNMGTLKKSHDTLKRRNVVTSSIPIFTQNSKRQRLDQLREMYYPHVAANDMKGRGGPEFQHPVIKDVPNTAKTHQDEAPIPHGDPIGQYKFPFADDDMMGRPDLPPRPPKFDKEKAERQYNAARKYENDMLERRNAEVQAEERRHQVQSVINDMVDTVESKHAEEGGEGEDIFPPDIEYEIDENESDYIDTYDGDPTNQQKVEEMIESDRNNLIVKSALKNYFPSESDSKIDASNKTKIARTIADVRSSDKKDATQILQEQKQQEDISTVAIDLGPRFEIIANEREPDKLIEDLIEQTESDKEYVIKKKYEHEKIGDKSKTRAQKSQISHIERMKKKSNPKKTDITTLASQIYKDPEKSSINEDVKATISANMTQKKALTSYTPDYQKFIKANHKRGIGRAAALKDLSENQLNQI